MHDISETASTLGSILKKLLLGENFDNAFPYAVVIVLLALLVGLYRSGYNVGYFRKKFKNFSVTTLIYFVNLFAFGPFVVVAGTSIQSGYDWLGLPQLDPALWDGIPIWVLVPISLLAFDFADYWSHRLMHKSWLWPVHAVHHSETEMTGLTTYRVHFLEPIIMGVSYVVLLTWLAMPENVLGYGAILITLHNVYVHMDMDWGHGPFRHLLASPRYHRWHHANVPRAYGKNLANIFPFYDVLFGTYYVPGTCTAKLGVDGVPEDDVVKLVLHPFREWSRMLMSVVRKPWRRKPANTVPGRSSSTGEHRNASLGNGVHR